MNMGYGIDDEDYGGEQADYDFQHGENCRGCHEDCDECPYEVEE
jgi:hypothetical protein